MNPQEIIRINHKFTPGIIEEIPLSQLKLSSMPLRSSESELQQLAESIREKGLLQPIIARPKADYFEVIAGNRRYSACKFLGWRKVACYVVELDDKEAFEVSLVENLQRKAMDPIEEGEAFRKYVQDFGWGGVSELAKRIGKSPSYICKRIEILTLPQNVLASIRNKVISPSKAEELLRIDNENKQSELAQLIARRHLSVHKVRELIDENVASKSTSDIEERAFNKSITILRVALAKLAPIIEAVEDHWVMHEVLMQNKNILHSQIDILLKQKSALRRDRSVRAFP